MPTKQTLKLWVVVGPLTNVMATFNDKIVMALRKFIINFNFLMSR